MSQVPPAELAALAKDDLGPTVTAVCIMFTVISFTCVVLRFFTRIKLTQNVGLEDYFIALSMGFSITMTVFQTLQVSEGTGKHMLLLTLPEMVLGLKYLYFSILFYCVSLTLTKVSILLQYRRIFTLRSQRVPIYIAMCICVAYGIESVLTGTFSCIPVDAFWNVMKQPTARCVDENALYYANAGLNIATDLMVAALPVKAIWELQIVRRQKVVLMLILTLGWFVCIVSMLRLNALVVLARHPLDSTYYGAATAYWSSIEINLAIVCASTPALKPLVVRIVPRFASHQGSNKSGSNNSKVSSNRKSFIELKGKDSQATISEDLERGDHALTALPKHDIMVTRDFEQHSELERSDSEHGSHKDLVSKYAYAVKKTGTQ